MIRKYKIFLSDQKNFRSNGLKMEYKPQLDILGLRRKEESQNTTVEGSEIAMSRDDSTWDKFMRNPEESMKKQRGMLAEWKRALDVQAEEQRYRKMQEVEKQKQSELRDEIRLKKELQDIKGENNPKDFHSTSVSGNQSISEYYKVEMLLAKHKNDQLRRFNPENKLHLDNVENDGVVLPEINRSQNSSPKLLNLYIDNLKAEVVDRQKNFMKELKVGPGPSQKNQRFISMAEKNLINVESNYASPKVTNAQINKKLEALANSIPENKEIEANHKISVIQSTQNNVRRNDNLKSLQTTEEPGSNLPKIYTDEPTLPIFKTEIDTKSELEMPMIKKPEVAKKPELSEEDEIPLPRISERNAENLLESSPVVKNQLDLKQKPRNKKIQMSLQLNNIGPNDNEAQYEQGPKFFEGTEEDPFRKFDSNLLSPGNKKFKPKLSIGSNQGREASRNEYGMDSEVSSISTPYSVDLRNPINLFKNKEKTMVDTQSLDLLGNLIENELQKFQYTYIPSINTNKDPKKFRIMKTQKSVELRPNVYLEKNSERISVKNNKEKEPVSDSIARLDHMIEIFFKKK